MMEQLRRALSGRRGLVAVLLVYAALHARALSYGFVWDDVETLQNNRFLEQPLGVVLRSSEHERMGGTERMQSVQTSHEPYRPVNVLTHWIDVRLFGRRPGPMHASNLALGALTIALAWALMRRAFASDRAALAGAWIIAVHPIWVEPSAYISSRADVTVALLVLASLNALLCAEEPSPARSGWVVCGALFYGAAFFAKEPSIGLPIVVVAWLLLGRRWREAAWVGTLLAVESAGLLALRSALLPRAPMTHGDTVGRALWEIPAALRAYFTTFVLPLDISTARPLDDSHAGALWVLFGLLAAGASWLWRIAPEARAPDTRRALTGLVWMVVFLAPTALAARSLGALADRYACLATVGFAITLVATGRLVLARWGSARAALTWGFVGWTAALIAISWVELSAWRSDDELARHAVDVEPTSAIAWYRFGYKQAQRRRWPGAVAAFERSAQLNPTSGMTWNNLGVSLLNLGQIDAAEHAFREALRVTDGVWFRAWYNLSLIDRGRGDTARTCRDLAQALAIAPGYSIARADQRQLCAAAPGLQRR